MPQREAALELSGHTGRVELHTLSGTFYTLLKKKIDVYTFIHCV